MSPIDYSIVIYLALRVLSNVDADGDAPAYRQMTPGSQWLYDLNLNDLSRPVDLTNTGIDMIVVAGTKKEFWAQLIHDEIDRQQDGVVAVASASLLDHGIPLLSVNANHSGIPQQISPDFVRAFLSGQTAGQLAAAFEEIDAVALPGDSDPLVLDENIKNREQGVVAVWMPGIGPSITPGFQFENDEIRVKRKSDDVLRLERLVLGRDKNVLQLINDVDYQNESFFFALKRELAVNDLGFNGAGLLQVIPESQEAGYEIEIGNDLLGKAGVTTEDRLPYVFVESRYIKVELNAEEKMVLLASNGSKSGSVGKVAGTELRFQVDALTDSTLFFLSTDANNPILAQEITLQLPSGQLVTPEMAAFDERYAFSSREDRGYAYYFLRQPEPGEYVMHHAESSESVLGASLLASPLSTELVGQDTSFVPGNTLPVALRAYGVEVCSSVDASARIVFDPDTVPTLIDQFSLIESEPDLYSGNTVVDFEGYYDVEATLTCETENGIIERLAVGTVLVAEDISVSNEEANEPDIPNGFRLGQNYPNPFKESTTISYSLPQAADVTITVFDVLGRRVKEYDLGTKPAGRYEEPFYASELSAGIYLYRLQAGEFVVSRQMVVLR